MRIGLNILPLFPGQIGGMERYTSDLLAHSGGPLLAARPMGCVAGTTDVAGSGPSLAAKEIAPPRQR